MTSNHETEHPEADANGTSASGRLLHMAGALLTVHLEIAQQEVAEEQARIVRGLSMLAVSWMCLCMILLLVQVIAVIGLHELSGLRWLWSVVITMSADLVICIMLRWLGTRQLKAPVLPATRALMRKTISALRN